MHRYVFNVVTIVKYSYWYKLKIYICIEMPKKKGIVKNYCEIFFTFQ